MHTINTLTIKNSALCLIDHQPWVAFPVNSITPELLTNNVLALAKTARTLAVPTVLTTINGRSGPLKDPLFQGLRALWPDVEPIDRTNTNAWSDPAFVEAVQATGRTKLVMAGLLDRGLPGANRYFGTGCRLRCLFRRRCLGGPQP